MNADVDQVTGALAKFDSVSAGIQALKTTHGGVIFDVATTVGMEAAKAARAAIREPRYEVERVRKAAKAPLLAIGKRLDSEAERITMALLEIESPIHAQIQGEEDRKEAEKQARIKAELDRVAKIHERIAEIRGAVTAAGTCRAELVLEHIADVEAIPVDDTFAEFRQQAQDAKDATIAKLRELHTAAVAREAEAARVKAEREELARLRAEAETRAAAERQAEATARAERERQEAADRAERQRQEAAERAQRRAEADAEALRLAAERRVLEEQQRAQQEWAEAEQLRLESERAELERRKLALQVIDPPVILSDADAAAHAALAANPPTFAEMVDVLAAHYGVATITVIGWLMDGADWGRAEF